MIVAAFPDADTLQHAANSLLQAGLPVETRTPVALPQDEHGPSIIPLAMLIFGLVIFAAAFAMQCFATMVGYPILVGGRPAFFWTSYTVFAFECAALAANCIALFAYLAINGLPRFWEPADECDALREASRDGWFLVTDGPEARQLLSGLHPLSVEQVPK